MKHPTRDAQDVLRAQLHAFAAHMRDPATRPAPPSLEARRVAVYRELVFNNLRSLLSSNFPVISKTLGETRWNALVRAFLVHHRSQTPLFTELGHEFALFLDTPAGQTGFASEVPWLAELAHYEWVELALQIADATAPPHDAQGHLMTAAPVVSPLAWPLAYRWPVQTIGPGSMPTAPGATPTLLLVRRDTAGTVHFSELSPLVYRLLELLGDVQAQYTGEQALLQLAQEANASDMAEFLDAGAAMLTRLHEEGTILGTRLSPP